MIKISLPNISIGKNANAHPYPCQIAYQAQEFIQGAIFCASISDISSGNYLKKTNSIEELKKQFIGGGAELSTWEGGWLILDRYKDIFKITVFQNVLVAINSHWDWYIRNLGNFVIFARDHVQSPFLSKKEESELNRVGFLSICHQIATLEKSCGVGFGISDGERGHLKEMSLVRNLALHNRWEVDQKYLDNTYYKKQWNIGQLRLFDSSELGLWHQSLLGAVKKSWQPIAIKYVNAPSFPK
jgi:hypothetical protein